MSEAKIRAKVTKAMRITLAILAVSILAILGAQLLVMMEGSLDIVPYLWATRRLTLALFSIFAAILLGFIGVIIAYEILIRYLVYKDKQIKGEI